MKKYDGVCIYILPRKMLSSENSRPYPQGNSYMDTVIIVLS